MAQLRNLGQPFGSPGGIINIPAPAGSALAGQIQMRAMEGIGQALGIYMGQQKQKELRQEDIRRLQAMGPQQDIFNTMYGARGMQAPQAQMPQMVSPMGQELALKGQLGNMFRDPLEREYLRERIGATRALTKQRGEPETLEDKYKFWLDRRARAEGRDPLTGLLTGTRNEGDLELIDKKLAVIRKQFEKRDTKPPPSPPQRDTTVVSGRFYRGPNITKEQFDSTLRMLKTSQQKQRYINDNWRSEFGRHIK